MKSVFVRSMLAEDIPAVVAMQRACYPEPFPDDLLWKADHLISHLAKFPEGQFVALRDGWVVGSASNNRIAENNWLSHANWETTHGGFTFETYSPIGSTLYGADISVHPRARGIGVGRMLYEARFELVRNLRLTRYGTGCRLPDLAASGVATPQEYVQLVQAEWQTDRTLTPLLRYGLRMVGVIEEYMEDAESKNAAALLEWTP